MDNNITKRENTVHKNNVKYAPLVTIVTPVFNGIRYLELCLQSVLNQSYPYIEHVLVDGGSTDGTVDMLSRYQAKYPGRIRFISEPDKGAVDAANKGWKMGRGDIFGWIGSDDIFEPDAVENVVEFFKINPEVYFVFGGYVKIDKDGKIIFRPKIRDYTLKDTINGRCSFQTVSAFYKREVIDKIGPMDTSINSADIDFYIRVGQVFKIYRIDSVLARFRIWDMSVGGRKGAWKMYARESLILNRRYGGNKLSGYMRYIRLNLMEFFNPVLGSTYSSVARLLRRE